MTKWPALPPIEAARACEAASIGDLVRATEIDLRLFGMVVALVADLDRPRARQPAVDPRSRSTS